MDIARIFKEAGPLLKRNSSTILTGLGVAGSIGSLILGVKATPRALRKLEGAYNLKNVTGVSDDVPLTKVEVIKTVWVDYMPAVGLQVVTIASVIGAQSINMRKQAAIISAFSISEAALREYQERMAVEAPTKDRKVRDDIAQARVDGDPVTQKEVLMIGNGDQLFYEAHTGRYFMSTMQKVQKAVNDLNFRVLNQNYASQNEFYGMLGLGPVAQGEEFGWTPEHTLEVDFSTTMSDDERAAISIDYYRKPVSNYWKGFS